jgi:hypothetical protein
MPEDFDSLREKAGINKLDLDQRKKLFEDFVTHGGQVIEEKRKPRGIITGSRRRPRSPAGKTDVRTEIKPEKNGTVAKKPDSKPGWQTTKTQQQPSRLFTSPKKRTAKKKRFKLGDRARTFSKGLLLNVFTFGGKRFSKKFVKFVNKQIKESMINLNITVSTILHGNYSIREDINRLSTGDNVIFYEILVRLSAIYDEQEFSRISKLISNRNFPQPAHIELFKEFYKRMYILGQYREVCKLYMEKSIDIQCKSKKIDATIAPKVKNQLKKDIEVILGDLLDKIHIILCKMGREFFPPYSQKLDDFLAISEQDKIGYISRLERKKRDEDLKKRMKERQRAHEEAIRRDEEIKIPKHVLRGFPLIEKEIEKYEKKLESSTGNPLLAMDRRDKMFKCIELFNIFDDQYSFVLTTSKINYNIEFRDQKKIDIKEDLSHAYLLMSETREDIKNYLDIAVEIKKTMGNLRLSSHQKSSLLDTHSKKQTMLSSTCRKKLIDVMKDIENTLSIVISDYNSAKQIVQNPDEHLYFDEIIDGVKRLHGKKNIEAILETFLFAATFAFMVAYGELSGIGLLVEEKEDTKKEQSGQEQTDRDQTELDQNDLDQTNGKQTGLEQADREHSSTQ